MNNAYEDLKTTKRIARVFGMIKKDNDYISIFECGCGNKEWIAETGSMKEYKCKKCGKKFVLVKNWAGAHYSILCGAQFREQSKKP